MIGFKNFLTEGTDASTLFEGVIAVCLSMSGYSQKRFKDNILKQKEVKAFLKVTKSDWAVDGKTKKEKADIFWNFSQLCKSKLPATTADAGFGQTKPKISAFWTNTTGKGVDTSKADIKVGKYQCSVKGPKAQLMSGEVLKVHVEKKDKLSVKIMMFSLDRIIFWTASSYCCASNCADQCDDDPDKTVQKEARICRGGFTRRPPTGGVP